MIPPIEKKNIIWYYNGKFYTLEELMQDKPALLDLQNKIFTNMQIDENLLKTIAKERIMQWKDWGKLITLSGKSYTVPEIKQLVMNESGIGKNILQAEEKRVLRVLEALHENLIS